MSFSIDWIAFFLALILLAFLIAANKLAKKHHTPAILYPSLKKLSRYGTGRRAYWHRLPLQLKCTALIAFIIAFIDPHFSSQASTSPDDQPWYTEGSAIYFLIDRSGSMGRKVVITLPDETVSFGTKIDALKKFTTDFIHKRPSDLFGIVAFARGATIISPLTIDHQTVIDQLSNIDVVQEDQQNGSSIGYGIYKTANIIAATKHYAKDIPSSNTSAYDIKGSAIILVTDGFQSPHPDDKGNRLRTIGIEEAAEYASSQGIRLYIVSLDPAITGAEFTPHRNLLKRSAEKTGGTFFSVEDAGEVTSVFEEIDSMERSRIPISNLNGKVKPLTLREVSFYQSFIMFGLLFLIAAVLLETLYLRRVP